MSVCKGVGNACVGNGFATTCGCHVDGEKSVGFTGFADFSGEFEGLVLPFEAWFGGVFGKGVVVFEFGQRGLYGW